MLTELSFTHIKIDDSVLKSLTEAVKLGHLPKLSHLGFEGCGSALKGKLSVFLDSKWPTLTHVNLKGCYLEESDLQILTQVLAHQENGIFPRLTSLDLDLCDELDRVWGG